MILSHATARSVLGIATLAGFLGGTVPARAELTPIAREARPSFVSAYAGTVVWSSYDAPAHRYRLKARYEGRVHRLPIPGRRIQFDVDVGPGPDGSTTAVYSRCRHDDPGDGTPELPLTGGGCHIWAFDFETGRERRVPGLRSRGHVEIAPTLWRRGIAFVRLSARVRGDRKPAIMVRRAGRRVHRVGGGSPGRAIGILRPAPTRLDLRGDRLAFSWLLAAPRGECIIEPRGKGYSSATELWVVDLGVGRRRVAAGCEYDRALSFRDASLTRDGVVALMQRRFDEPDPGTLRGRLTRISTVGAPTVEVDFPADGGDPVDATQDGSTTYLFASVPDRREPYLLYGVDLLSEADAG